MNGSNKSLLFSGLLCLLLVAGPIFGASAQEKPAAAKPAAVGDQKPPIHPEADRLLKGVSKMLVEAKDYSFKAEVWEDEDAGGHKVSTTKTMDLKVRRPDRLQVEFRSPKRSRGYWFDGRSITILDRAHNLYSAVETPGTIDQALDAAEDNYGIVLPLEDLLVNDPYASISPTIQGAAYFGKVTVLGTPCRHLGVSTSVVDWQLWVADGPRPLPRKLVITYKLLDGAPQYTAILSDWKFNQGLPDKTFAFRPPKGAARIDTLPAKGDERNVPEKK